MKRLMIFLAATATLTLLPVNEASAGCNQTRIVGYTRCGKPIYSYFHVTGYDRCGNPVGHWDTRYPSSCRCRSHPSGHDHHHRSRSGWSFNFRY